MLLLGNIKLDFRKSDLPCLIHGIEGSGVSFFSISLLAEQYYLHGSKILFFSAKPMAQDGFLKQIEEKKAYVIDNEQLLNNAYKNQAVFINSGDQEWFLKVVENLSDIDERVIFVKNIELYDEKVFQAVKDKKNVIISGDIDKSPFKKTLLQKDYATKVFFSQPQFNKNVALPQLQKYQGYLMGNNKTGIVWISSGNTYIEDYQEPDVYTKLGGKVIVLNKEGKILLIQRSEKSGGGGRWDFPGGGVEFGENPIHAAKREIHEEAGLLVDNVKPLYIQTFVHESDEMVVMVGYKAEALSENVQLSWEHDSYKWVTKEEALQMGLPEFFHECIKNI